MADKRGINRRTLLAAGGSLWPALALVTAVQAGPIGRIERDAAGNGGGPRRMHGGKGNIDVKFFFEADQRTRPALFLQYDIPPGASEGVHTHGTDEPDGPWDEFYYIVKGSGQMIIDGERVQVHEGDNIHTPLGVAHGIENTSPQATLRIFLVAIHRD
jgi:mannose-6-phosphate isomerase-like protein (cupin superfamily)